MSESIDRASAIRMAGLACIGTLLASLSERSDADAKSPFTTPMNLTVKTAPSAKGPRLCYTIVIGDQVPVPANADTLIHAHIGGVHADVKGGPGSWKPMPTSGDGGDEWLTVYVTSC